MGHSVSAMAGLLAAIREPKWFARQIWIGPSARYLNDAPNYVGGFEPADIDEFLNLMDHNFLRWAGVFAPAIMGNANQPGLGQELEQSFCSTDTAVMQQFARVTLLSDNRRDLSKLQVPTLILQCADDIIAPLVVGEYIQSQLPRWYTVVYESYRPLSTPERPCRNNSLDAGFPVNFSPCFVIQP